MLDAHISTVFNGNCHKFHYNLFCEQVFYYFDHIYIKKNLFFIFIFLLRVQTFFWGVQCMLMHPRRTGPAEEANFVSESATVRHVGLSVAASRCAPG